MALSQRPDIPTSKAERPPLSNSTRPDRAEQLASAADVLADEAVDRAKEDPDAVLQQAETLDEAARLEELSDWASEKLPDLQPNDLTAKALHQIEQEEAAAGFPDFRVTDEVPDSLRAEVSMFLREHELERQASVAQSEIDDGVPVKVPAKAGEQSRLLEQESALTREQQNLTAQARQLSEKDRAGLEQESQHVERNADAQGELEILQTEFLTLKANIGTEAALRQILAKATITEAQQHIRAVLSTIGLLKTALPDKAPALTRLLNAAPLDLGAANVTASFAAVLASAETSSEFTPEDVETMRQIINKQAIYVRTGTHVQTELGQTQTDANGQTVPAHPENDPLKFRLNVVGFAEDDGTQKLRATTVHGERVTLDITGWSGADIGRASELLQLWAMTENEGQTDYLASITKLNWSDTASIDPITLQHSAQVVSAVLGHGEGHDGDIFQGDDAIGVIRWQAQLADLTGDTIRGHRDAERTNDALTGLGIRDGDGNLDLDVLRAFGDYSRNHWHTVPDFDAVRAHLVKLFPGKFEKSV